MNWKIPLFKPGLDDGDIQAAMEPLREEWLTMGERTRRFEEAFAERLGAKHAFAVSSGTAALHLALAAAGVGPGGEVLLPSLTFVACANTVVQLGARPVFVDVADQDDWTLGPAALEAAAGPKAKAVIAVHYAGFPARMEEINRIADERGLAVIEDCAHALFTRHGERNCGTWGTFGCFSFFSNKNMTTGEGGMIAAADDASAERVRLLRSHGMTTLTLDRHKGHAKSYDVLAPGYNYRIDEIRAALGLSQLRKLDGFLEKRRMVYQWFLEELADVDKLSIPFRGADSNGAGIHIFPVRLKTPEKRAAFMEGMQERGIQTSIHYPAIHRFQAYREMAKDAKCPITEAICASEVTLPFHPYLTRDEVGTIGAAARELLARG